MQLRLVVEDVESGPGEGSIAQSLHQGGFVHHVSPCGVDQERPATHAPQALAVHQVTSFRSRRTVERHIFPGYVLVNMQLTEESWYVVRNTPGVTGFVGMGNQPTPLRPEEVSQIIKRMEAEAPTVKVTFKVGERVRIIDGPFNDFRGVVSEIDMERTKVRVMVSFFGRETPVELDFLQVEKA